MNIYTIQHDRIKEENPYSVWLRDELIEDDLSFGEALYWTFRELQKWIQEIFNNPQQEYTRTLLGAVPSLLEA